MPGRRQTGSRKQWTGGGSGILAKGYRVPISHQAGRLGGISASAGSSKDVKDLETLRADGSGWGGFRSTVQGKRFPSAWRREGEAGHKAKLAPPPGLPPVSGGPPGKFKESAQRVDSKTKQTACRSDLKTGEWHANYGCSYVWRQ